jgi:type VI secretion system protein ImpA
LIDFSSWLSSLDGDSPSGVNLRDLDKFAELEALIGTGIERDDREDHKKKAPPVDWSDVLERAEALHGQGRDVRLLVIVVRALTNLHGFPGLAQGLSLVTRTFELHWDTVYPQLRDGVPPAEAALRRLGALSQLADPRKGPLPDLQRMTLISAGSFGDIQGKDLERLGRPLANGKDRPDQNEAAEQEVILARLKTIADKRPDMIGALPEDIRDAAAALAGLDAQLAERVPGNGGAAPALKRFIEAAATGLDRRGDAAAQAAQAAPVEAPSAPEAPVAALNGSGHAPAAPAGPGSFPARLASRDEVVKCLDLIVAFYDRTEPSSPIPHLARRIRRMVHMDFVELMEDLAPSGLKEFRLLAGVPDAKKAAQKDER